MADIPFDLFAKEYDAWFDSANGERIFDLESSCLEKLVGKLEGDWLEIGVGTGRFAETLGIKQGIDPSSAALEIAATRGVQTQVGCGEDLPYPDAGFDGVLLVVAFCFLADPLKTLKESFRVLKQNGSLIVGFVPSESSWGIKYTQKAREGHRFYSKARFYTCDHIVSLAAEAGFVLDAARSCLLSPPDEPITNTVQKEGIIKNAGFVAMKFKKALSIP
jgi:ubiquinone/menaquinone biosynthesis C-methylase UbiE